MKSIKLYFKNLIILCLVFKILSLNNLKTNLDRSTNKKKQDASNPTSGINSAISTGQSTNQAKPAEIFAKPDLGVIWADLFVEHRHSSCQDVIAQKNIISQLMAEQERKRQGQTDVQGIVDYDTKFSWIENWGFGPSAYLFDYLDPVFRDDIVKEMESIYDFVIKQDPNDLPEYKDPFNYAARSVGVDPQLQVLLLGKAKKLNANKDSNYDKAVNAVQVYKSMKEFKWFIDPGSEDFATDFVINYDINHDGRLSPRELILGSIVHNKDSIGSDKCNHCYTNIGKKIFALFSFLDCEDSGFITADQLWKSLPSLRRPTSQFNIFSLKNSENIRSNAINDFVLKHGRAKKASVNKVEFISGLLLGFWQRQTTDASIVKDDSKSLKAFRWSENNTKDTLAYSYVENVNRTRIQQEEMARFQRYEREMEKEKERVKQMMNNSNSGSTMDNGQFGIRLR